MPGLKLQHNLTFGRHFGQPDGRHRLEMPGRRATGGWQGLNRRRTRQQCASVRHQNRQVLFKTVAFDQIASRGFRESAPGRTPIQADPGFLSSRETGGNADRFGGTGTVTRIAGDEEKDVGLAHGWPLVETHEPVGGGNEVPQQAKARV